MQVNVTAYGQQFARLPMYGIVFAFRGTRLIELPNVVWQAHERRRRWSDPARSQAAG